MRWYIFVVAITEFVFWHSVLDYYLEYFIITIKNNFVGRMRSIIAIFIELIQFCYTGLIAIVASWYFKQHCMSISFPLGFIVFFCFMQQKFTPCIFSVLFLTFNQEFAAILQQQSFNCLWISITSSFVIMSAINRHFRNK